MNGHGPHTAHCPAPDCGNEFRWGYGDDDLNPWGGQVECPACGARFDPEEP